MNTAEPESGFDAKMKPHEIVASTMSLPESPGRRLYLLQKSDPLKHWWSLSEMRRCVKCGQLFTGFDIRLEENAEGVVHFHCPTPDCDGSWEHWEYPELHL